MLRLYESRPSGNCYKVRLLLNQLGIQYEPVAVDPNRGETRTESFAKLNPNGKVPLLVLEDDTALAESGAILWYLARDSQFLPGGRRAQAQVLQWMFFEQYSHEPYIATLRNWIAYAKTADEHAAEIERLRPRGYAALGVMDDHLARNDFLAAGRYSIADIALYAYTHVAHEGSFDLGPYAALRRWMSRVAMQPDHIGIGE